MRRAVALALIACLACPPQAFAAKRKSSQRTVYPTAVSALLWDVTNNRRLYAKNIDRKVYPASTTKVMTVLLALERLPLDRYITVGRAPTRVQPTKLSLRPGEQYRVRDLLYAMLLKSANDAAVVLAEAMAGSEDRFVSLMNQKAASLGARHTKFANAHGLPSSRTQYTTAQDMALIFRAALKHPFFRQAITYKHRIIYSRNGRRFFLKSHNKILFMKWKSKVFGKTGYTIQAQSCFVGYFTMGKRQYIIDVFGCRKRWDDIKHIIEKHGKIDL